MPTFALHLAVQYADTARTPSRAQLRRWVAAALARLPESRRPTNGRATLTIRFVDEAEGRSLNRTFRGKDHATNVLTFPLVEPRQRRPSIIEADIVICRPVVEAEARAQRKTPHVHFAHLVIHGVLHAAGYDHEEPREADAMEALEGEVLARFGIADPYAG